MINLNMRWRIATREPGNYSPRRAHTVFIKSLLYFRIKRRNQETCFNIAKIQIILAKTLHGAPAFQL